MLTDGNDWDKFQSQAKCLNALPPRLIDGIKQLYIHAQGHPQIFYSGLKSMELAVKFYDRNYQELANIFNQIDGDKEQLFSRIDQMKNDKKICGKVAHCLKICYSNCIDTFDKKLFDPSYDAKQKPWLLRNFIPLLNKGIIGLGSYVTEDGQLHGLQIDEMQRETQYINFTSFPEKLSCSIKQGEKTSVDVVNQDSYKQGLLLKEQGYNPVIMDMACNTHPGGGYWHGARAQEEDLQRRSTLHYALNPQLNETLQRQMPNRFLIGKFGLIYVPKVDVFRKTVNEEYKLTSPEKLDVIAICAYNLKNEERKQTVSYDEGMKAKTRIFLRQALASNHDAVVLGALGAGAFGGDGEQVAKIYTEVLEENEFLHQFKHVRFAIKDDHNGANFKKFAKIPTTINGQYYRAI
jgi:uncharacterized protein (TIGR02452 family)